MIVRGALSLALAAACLFPSQRSAAQDLNAAGVMVATHVIPGAGPQILAMSISDLAFRPGETVTGHVETSSNVTAVEIHVGLWGMTLQHAGHGYFEGTGRIPHLPFFLKGRWTMHVVAKTANGQKTERDLSIRLL